MARPPDSRPPTGGRRSRDVQASGKQRTDDGQYHQVRSLKARADEVKRPVPACPEVVVILRAHVDEFGAAEGGRLFGNQRGHRLALVSYESVWWRAREHVLTAAQLATPLAQPPYDLRHASLSLWLNSGVPGANVAARAGHSVAMLQSTYAHLSHPGARVPRSFRDYRRTITHRGSRRHTREASERGSDAGGNGSGRVDEPSPAQDVWRLHSAG